MGEKITSILFLAILALVPIGMVVGITITIVKRVGLGQSFKAAAAKYGWKYLGNDEEAISTLSHQLDYTLYSIQPGKHELSHIIAGMSSGVEFSIVRYHHAADTPFAERRKAGYYTLIVMGRGGEWNAQYWFMHRFQGKLAAIAEKAAGSSLSIPSDPAWSWSLFSSLEALSSAGFEPDAGSAFRELTQPGDAIFVFDEVVIYATQKEFSSSFAESIQSKIAIIRKHLKW